MIQVGVIGSSETAFFAAKRGFVVFGVDPELQQAVREADVRIDARNAVEALELIVRSVDIIIIGKGKQSELAKQVARAISKPLVEGDGKEAVDKAAEKLVRYNLFGKKE